MENSARVLSGLNIVAGIWLIISPFILPYTSGVNAWQQVVFGAIVALFGIVRLRASEFTWPTWLNFMIGLWFVIAPWTATGVSHAAQWNEVVLGIVVAALAYGSSVITMQHRTLQQH